VKCQLGLTLVELMVGLAIIGLLLLIAIPPFSDYVRNNQIRSLADELHASLQQTKYEAIKRNARTNLVIANTGNWSIRIPANESGAEEVLLEYIPAQAKAGIVISTANNTVSFNSQGRLADGGPYTLDIMPQNSADCISPGGKLRCLRLQISTAGQIRLCDLSLKSTDPRSCG